LRFAKTAKTFYGCFTVVLAEIKLLFVLYFGCVSTVQRAGGNGLLFETR